MEWLDSTILIAFGAFLVLVVFLAQEYIRVRRTVSGELLGTMRVPKVGFIGRSARLQISVRRRAEGGVQVIVGSRFSPLDTLQLTGEEASRLAHSLECAAAELQ
jgi:hypothetical protein